MKAKKVYTGKAKYAKQGVNCRICRIWLKKGERKANQFLCCNDDSRILTSCQKRYYKAKRDKALEGRAIPDYGHINCDICKSYIKKQDPMQKRCTSGIKGKLSECQKEGVRRNANNKDDNDPAETAETTKRICLKCGEFFDSIQEFNRICEKCDDLNTKAIREYKMIMGSQMKEA